MERWGREGREIDEMEKWGGEGREGGIERGASFKVVVFSWESHFCLGAERHWELRKITTLSDNKCNYLK